MHLTAVFKLRANKYDRRRLSIALSRWAAVLMEALDRARARQQPLLRCLVMWHSADGSRQRLVLDPRRLREVIRDCLKGRETHLHASARASLTIALEELIGSWLGLYLDWLEHNRTTPKPQFPTVAVTTPRVAQERFTLALAMSSQVITLPDEERWRSELCRSGHRRSPPLWFGAATSGGEPGLNHCGLLRRADGRYFALLTLWPLGDPLGGPVQRAHNRLDAGSVRNVRAEVDFSPTDRARSSMLVPLEMGRGHELLFFGRAQPRSAQLVRKGEEYSLHVAFELPDHTPVALSGNIMAVQRGVNTLLGAVVIDLQGRILHREAVTGQDLARLISEIRRVRVVAQQNGRTRAGDRRASRVTEHHLYSAGHQLIDVARRYEAEIVLLPERGARRSHRFIAYRHLNRLKEILSQLAAEAGLPLPNERKIYGSWRTCVRCGWIPGDPVRQEQVDGDQCPGCAARRDPEYQFVHLLALDTLRLKQYPQEDRPSLDLFIRQLNLDAD